MILLLLVLIIINYKWWGKRKKAPKRSSTRNRAFPDLEYTLNVFPATCFSGVKHSFPANEKKQSTKKNIAAQSVYTALHRKPSVPAADAAEEERTRQKHLLYQGPSRAYAARARSSK